MARKTGKGGVHPGRLRYPEDKEAAALAAALPLDEQRGKTIPNKLENPEVAGMLIAALAFATVEVAAQFVGVAPSSIYDKRKRDPGFDERCVTARARRIAAWEITLDAVASNPRHPRCVDAGKFLLTFNKPEVYRQRSELELTAPIETVEIVKAASNFMREQRRLTTPVAEVVDLAIVKAIVGEGGNGNGNGSNGGG